MVTGLSLEPEVEEKPNRFSDMLTVKLTLKIWKVRVTIEIAL